MANFKAEYVMILAPGAPEGDSWLIKALFSSKKLQDFKSAILDKNSATWTLLNL